MKRESLKNTISIKLNISKNQIHQHDARQNLKMKGNEFTKTRKLKQ